MAIWKQLNEKTGVYEEIAGSSVQLGSTGIKAQATHNFALYSNNPTFDNKTNFEMYDIYKYPPLPVWGQEYLGSWYKKLYNGDNVVIACDGDSTTEGGALDETGKRHNIIKRIMVDIAKYPSNLLTVYNNGRGSRCTGDYVGSDFGGYGTDSTDYPNGLMELGINQNADLIISMHGVNDMDKNRNTKTIQERLDVYEANLTEFLQRVRGATTKTINGRPCYGKSIDDTAIILVVPVRTRCGDYTDGSDWWSYHCRRVIQKLCREYQCGFFDPTVFGYDHNNVNNWSVDNLHPSNFTNCQFMSEIQPLIAPMGLWNLHTS